MASRFIQGDGYPILSRYSAANLLQETIYLPYVRDDGNNSYVRQYFTTYPTNDIRQFDLLSGATGEDKPIGVNFRCQIKYVSILASDLLFLYNCILNCNNNAGHYLKLKPRSDNNGTINEFKVIFKGDLVLDSSNMWKHLVTLDFTGTELLALNLQLVIPPVVPI